MDEIITDESMVRLKTIFYEMESFFHGKSSGFDPSVSFLKQPLPLYNCFLTDSKPGGKITEEGKALVRLIDHLVNSLLEFSDHEFWEMMKMFSLKQIEQFSPSKTGDIILNL